MSWKWKITTFSNDQIIHEQTKQINKRKRNHHLYEDLLDNSMKSISQLSISQQKLKKTKHSTSETISSNTSNANESNHVQYTFYKPSKYIKMHCRLTFMLVTFAAKLPFEEKEWTKIYFKTTYNRWSTILFKTTSLFISNLVWTRCTILNLASM